MYLTITLNPAIDKIATAETLKLGQNNPVKLHETLAAGRGVDVAKALRELGYPVTAGGFLGCNSASLFERLFISRGINDVFIRIKGLTRTNLHILDGDGGETEFMEPAPVITESEWRLFLERLSQILEGCDLVAVCGSVPESITPLMFSKMLDHIERYNLPILMDTEDKMLDVACTKRPALIKFNREKICRQLCKSDPTEQEMIHYGENLLKIGVKNVLISLDKDGALLVNTEGAFKASVPSVEIQSTIGCGDTMVASIAESLSLKRSSEDMLRHAMALAEANAMTLETAHVSLADYHELLPKVLITKL